MAIPSFAKVNARLDQSFFGRTLRRSFNETLGMHYSSIGSKGINKGFMGVSKSPLKAAVRTPYLFGKLAKRRGIGTALSFASRALVPGLAAMNVYQGYQEGGIWGAATSVAENTAINFGINTAIGLAGSPVAWGAAVVAAGGYAGYQFGEAVQRHAKNVKGLEFSAASVDLIGSAGALTDRGRAMQALNNSHLNGRIAIGNEGLLLHTSYR